MSFLRSLVALPFVAALALVGCAAPTDDTGASDVSNLTAQAPITLGNYVNHPKIVAIRGEVHAIESAGFAKADNPGCDGSTAKLTDSHGKIRKMTEIGGEDGSFGETDAYYGGQGGLRFIYVMSADEESKKATEQRVYIEGGRIIFQAIRDGVVSEANPDPDFSHGVDRLPTADEAVSINATFTNPAKWFTETGCPTNN